jgi:hypothetical protein
MNQVLVLHSDKRPRKVVVGMESFRRKRKEVFMACPRQVHKHYRPTNEKLEVIIKVLRILILIIQVVHLLVLFFYSA